MQTYRRHLTPLFLWSLFCALFFASLLIGWERLPNGDFEGQFHAFGLFQAHELWAGRFPLWLPGSYGGFPFAADIQSAAFYPPRLLTILFAPSFPLYALQVEVILHVWLAGIFTYGLAYELTHRRAAALIAAISFGLGGYLTSYPLLQVSLLETVIWLPLVLWLLRRAIQATGPNHRYLILAGLTLAFATLAGHPQTLLHLLYVAAAYTLYLSWCAGYPWVRILMMGLLLGGLTIGVAAVALFPGLHYALQTTRSDVSYAFIATGLPLQDFLQLLFPGVLSFWVPQYAGVLPLVLTLVAWFGHQHDYANRREIMFWSGLGVAAAWLSLGDAGILFQLWVKIAPGFSLFRQQERLLGVVMFCLAMLSAYGWRILTRLTLAQWFQVWSRLAWISAALFLAGWLYCGVNPWLSGKPWPLILLRQGIIWGSVMALCSYRLRRGPQPIILLSLFILLVADLYVGTYESISRQPGPAVTFWQQPDWMQTLQADIPPLARIDSRNLFHANLGPIYDLEDVYGISPLRPRWWSDYMDLPPARRWQLLGVSHVLAYESPPAPAVNAGVIEGGLYPDQSIHAYVFRLEQTLPRAWMVYEPRWVTDQDEALDLVADPAFDPTKQVVLMGSPVGETSSQPELTEVQVRSRRQQNQSLLVDVFTPTAGFLVISEWNYPGWQVSVNGERASLYEANGGLQAVWLPEGRHQVQLQFRPPDVLWGAAASLFTLVVALVLYRRPNVLLWLPSPPASLPRLEKRRLSLPALPLSAFPLAWPRFVPHLVTALIGLAFLLRLIGLAGQDLRGDEAYSFPFTQIPWTEVIPTLAPVGEEHAPLHYLVLNLWTKLAGDSELAMRYLAVMPGLLAVALTYQLGRRLRGRNLGLFLALMLTISQSLVWLGQDVRNQYVASTLLTTLTTLIFMGNITRPANSARRLSRWFPWLVYALACALTMYTHYYTVFTLLAHGLCLILLPAYRRYLSLWVGAGLIAAALFAPWFLATIEGWVGQLAAPPGESPQLATFGVTVGRELTVGPAFGYAWGRWLFLGAFLLALYGLYALWPKQKPWAIVLGAWLGLTASGVFLVSLRRYIFNDYYIAPATVAWWSLVGVALCVLWQRGKGYRLLASMSLSGLVLASLISLHHYYADPVVYGRNRGAKELATYITEHFAPGDIFISNLPDPILPYYLRHTNIPQAVQPAQQGEPTTVTEQGLVQLTQTYNRLWFLPSPSIWDEKQTVLAWLDYHLLTEVDLTFTNLRLVAYRPAWAVDDVMHPMGQPIGEAIVLDGAYVTVDGLPADLSKPLVVAPGSTLALTLVWHAAAPVPADFNVFVHLLASDGFLQTQADGVPLFGTRPTTTWLVGERLLDRHTFTIPETANLSAAKLVIGLYDPVTLERLPVAPGQDAALITLIDVQPLATTTE